MPSAQVIPIDSLDDARIAPYRNLKDRELARAGDLFIAEGEYVVRRLLASDYPVVSLLLAEKHVGQIAPLAGTSTVVYAAPHALVNQIIGFKFHSGVMAVGRRKAPPTLEQFTSRWGPRVTLCVCPEAANTENLGSMIRMASVLGLDGMILGEHCCDPFYRQAIRVSMGTVFHLPILRSANLLADLAALHERWGVERVATVLDPAAQPLRTSRRGPRLAVLFGNEAQGLRPEEVSACDRRVTIPMHLAGASLNVTVAAGIILYHFMEEAG